MGEKNHAMHGRDHGPYGMDPAGVGGFEIKVFADDTAVQTGDSAFVMCVPDDLDNARLTNVAAFVTTVSTSGAPTVQLRSITNAVDMLSTRITIDVSEFTSYTAAAPAVINVANSEVSTGDLIAVDVDVAGTGTTGLGVMLLFQGAHP